MRECMYRVGGDLPQECWRLSGREKQVGNGIVLDVWMKQRKNKARGATFGGPETANYHRHPKCLPTISKDG
jgi:hypothetical protein